MDRRKELRATISLPVSCKISETNAEFRHIQCRDVGTRGLCVLLPERLKPGAGIDVEMNLPQTGQSVSASGTVTWQRDIQLGGDEKAHYLTGFQFKKITPKDASLLRSVLEHHLQKKSEEETTRFLQAAALSSKAIESHKAGRKRRFTPNPPWVDELNAELVPYRQAILGCSLLEDAERGTLSLKQLCAWLTQMYPFIETFPRWIAMNLARTPEPHLRAFFIDNVRAEKRHAELWIDLANGFGVPTEELFSVEPIPEVDALTNWLWAINSKGSLPEGVAATNYAIEGIAQDISKKMLKGMPKYQGRKGTHIEKRTYWWLEEHAKYDDKHPLEALEVIKIHAPTPELQKKTSWAAKRSLEYMRMLYDACYERFKP